MINFDNTASVKALAKTVKLDTTKGNEGKLYNVGDMVKTSKVAPLNMVGKVTEAYEQNGYIYYIVLDDRGFKTTLRTKDIEGRIIKCM